MTRWGKTTRLASATLLAALGTSCGFYIPAMPGRAGTNVGLRNAAGASSTSSSSRGRQNKSLESSNDTPSITEEDVRHREGAATLLPDGEWEVEDDSVDTGEEDELPQGPDSTEMEIPALSEMKPSSAGPTVWSEFSALAAETGAPVNLGQGFPNWNPPDFVMAAAQDALSNGFHQYTRTAGHPGLVQLLAKRYSEHFGREVDPFSQVAITIGASQALYVSFQAILSAGDEVVLLEPFFDLYLGQIRMAGGVAKQVPLSAVDGGWRLDAEALRSAVSPRTRVIVVNTPHNPTGKVFSRQELEVIADVVRENPRVLVISDEVYESMVYGGPEATAASAVQEAKTSASAAPPAATGDSGGVLLESKGGTSAAREAPPPQVAKMADDTGAAGPLPAVQHVHFATLPDMWDRTITISSAGKTFSVTGWQVGWVMGPRRVIQDIHTTLPYMQFCAATPLQEALCTVLVEAEKPYKGSSSYYDWLRGKFAGKRRRLEEALSAAGIRPLKGEGGVFLVADVSQIKVPDKYLTASTPAMPVMTHDWAFCRWLAIEHGLVAIPISAFFSEASRAKGLGNGMVRFCFSKTDETIEEAAEVLARVAREQRELEGGVDAEEQVVAVEVGSQQAPGFEELANRAARRQEQRTRKLASAAKKENTKTDLFRMKTFHHVEFYCGDATTVASRFVWGLGMQLVAKSDQSTGNTQHASYVVQSNDLRFVFTAPYSLANALPPTATTAAEAGSRGEPSGAGPPFSSSCSSLPGFDPAAAYEFFRRHGLAARAIGIEVENATHAYEQCLKHGDVAAEYASVQPPTRVSDLDGRGSATISEVRAYGDVVFRFISFETEELGDAAPPGPHPTGGFTGAFLPNFVDVGDGGGAAARETFGLERVDHIAGNVWDMLDDAGYIADTTGMHEFAEFAMADVGTGDSGLNSIILASNNEMVLLNINEPTFGTAKKSQIQTFLEQNEGPGVQHIALKTNDIFRTMRLMKANSALGGFEFMEPPGPSYYRDVPRRIPSLTRDQLEQLEELGLLVDKEGDDGVLLQVFTKPVGDRPTFFLEIIQRIGCAFQATEGDNEGDQGVFAAPERQHRQHSISSSGPAESGEGFEEFLQRGGCGGFGQGNFKALFEAVEKYESTLETGAGAEGR